jgi:hypothetical protein
MLNLLAHRREFDGLAAAPSSLWPAFETGDASALNDFLRSPDPALKSLLVDFAQTRGNYEARIFDEGVLPVRKKSLHDLFNVLAWRTFPRAKAAINRIHKDAMATELPGKRGRCRDFLTLVDEAGVVVLVEDQKSAEHMAAEIRRVRQGDPADYPEEIRHLMAITGAQLTVFGHALFESLVLRPETLSKVGAFALVLPREGSETADGMLAEYLDSKALGLHPALFPSLRLDIVFKLFLEERKIHNSPG